MGGWRSGDGAQGDVAPERRLVALCWTGGPDVPLPRLLGAGALVWLAYTVAWIAIAGPVLDESALAGAVIAGDVVYPSGHPNALVYRRAPLLLYQLASLEWAITHDPWVVSALRNVLFLFASTFTAFAAAATCTRRPAWGHVAAALTLSETACSLVGVYLAWVFPGFYSTGHLGIHVAVLAVVLVAAGVERLGGVLAGLLLVIHTSMTLVAWPALALWLAWCRPPRWRRVLAGAGGGALMAVLVVATIAWRAAGDAGAPLYAAGADADVVLRTYAETTDPHRQPFPVRSALGLVGPAAFAALALVALASRDVHRAGAGALVAAGGVAWAWVFGTRAWQALAGGLPVAVLAVMPGRYANLAMLTVIPLAVTALAATGRAAPWLATGLLVVETGLALIDRPRAFAVLIDVILGVAMGGAILVPEVRRRAVGGALAIALAFVAVGRGGPFVAATLAAAGVGALVRRGGAERASRAVLATACVAAVLAASTGPHVPNAWDAGSERVSTDEQALATWLRDNVPPDAMLVAPLYPPAWLSLKTGHPVLVDTMTLANLPYFPGTASGVARIVRDVYGIDYADPGAVNALRGPDGMLRPTSPAWTRAWEARGCDDWRALADRYGFRHVWAPHAHPVRLPIAWNAGQWALHRVPDTCAPQATP